MGKDERFPDGACPRRLTESSLGADVQQRTEQAGIRQVEFGTLDDGFRAVREPWLEQHDLPGSLQRGQPMIRGGRSNAYISCQISLIQQVCRTEGASAQKTLEIPQATHVGQRSHVAFQIGGQIRVVEGHHIDVRVRVQLGKPAPHDGVFEHGLREGRTDLRQGECFQFCNVSPAG